jgi:hypothetical protein
MDMRPKPIELPERTQAEEGALVAQVAPQESEQAGKVND